MLYINFYIEKEKYIHFSKIVKHTDSSYELKRCSLNYQDKNVLHIFKYYTKLSTLSLSFLPLSISSLTPYFLYTT